MSDYLSVYELAQRYALPDMNIEKALYDLLHQWRDKNLLVAGRHVLIMRRTRTNQPYRVYSEARFAILILKSNHSLAESIRQVHADRLRSCLPAPPTTVSNLE